MYFSRSVQADGVDAKEMLRIAIILVEDMNNMSQRRLVMPRKSGGFPAAHTPVPKSRATGAFRVTRSIGIGNSPCKHSDEILANSLWSETPYIREDKRDEIWPTTGHGWHQRSRRR